MSHRTLAVPGKLLAVFMVLAVLFSVVAGVANADPARDATTPASAAAPDKITVPEAAKPGIYYLDYLNDYYRLDPITYPVDGAIGFWWWSQMQSVKGKYDWSQLDAWIKNRVDLGLETGIMISTYDATTANDIRSTPNYVIKIPDAVVPATSKDCASCPEYDHYINYFRRTNRKNLNGEFNSGLQWWTVSNQTAISVVDSAPKDSGSVASGPALQLGGNNVNATAIHDQEAIPAMPPSLTSPLQKNVYISARVHITTTDTLPNDHLYMEVWEGTTKLGGIDITNQSHPTTDPEFWQTYTLDASAYAAEKKIKVVFKVVNDADNPTTFLVDNVELRVRHLIPKYWGAAYLNEYKAFITALGNRYRGPIEGMDPKYRLQFVAMGTGVYGESQPTQSDNYPNSHFDHVMKNAGLTTSKMWTDFVNSVSDTYASAFQLVSGQGPNRHLFLQFVPNYMGQQERVVTSDFAASRSIGMSANFSAPDYTLAYKDTFDGAYDIVRKYWNQVPIAFESYSEDLCSPTLTYWAYMSSLEKHADYIRADDKLIRRNLALYGPNKEIFDFARQYLGKTIANTPKVWTVMREHRNPTMAHCQGGGVYYLSASSSAQTWPQLGNFNFWLYQVDSIPGGRTVPETNDKGADARYAYYQSGTTWLPAPDAGLGMCPNSKKYRTDLFGNNYPCFPNPYNPDLPKLEGQNLGDYTDYYRADDWTGGGKEAYVVRRTDQNKSDATKNNPYMFFMVDDGYMPVGQVYKANITVKYFDIGTDEFSIKYQSTTGEKIAGRVKKTGTKELKTITFTVSDGKFANGLMGGADFYLDSRDPDDNALDGNEWVHMVELEKLTNSPNPTDTPTATPTSTVTATPTATATPTITPTATPTTGIVEGISFHDLNSNGLQDAGEPGVAGAVMALRNSATGVEAYTAVSRADGVFNFPEVVPVQYALFEKTAPPGYIRNMQEVVLRVRVNDKIEGLFFGHKAADTPTPTVTPSITPTSTPTTPASQQSKLFLPMIVK